MIYTKVKSRTEAVRLCDFLKYKGIEDAEFEENDGFLSDKYPFHVVGQEEEALGLIERHETIVNVFTGSVKRRSTWMKSKDKWDETPRSIRT